MSQDNKVAIIYNKFDIDAVISAAFLKSLFKEVIAYDNLSNYELDLNKDTSYYLLGFRKVCNSMQQYKTTILNETQVDEGDMFKTSSILSKVLTGTKISNHIAEEIALLLPNFYKNELVERELLTIYSHYRLAINSLRDKDTFSFRVTTDFDKADFKSFMKDVKYDLTRYQTRNNNITKQFNVSVPIACVAEDTSVWVKRMLIMTHGKYINLVSSIRGQIVDTNITDIGKVTNNKDLILSTDF